MLLKKSNTSITKKIPCRGERHGERLFYGERLQIQ